ncbi:MAG: bifunctional sulfate adenylyltransferase/adenylylsulfate kinase [Pyrinomonadaceae bacterium]
MAEIEDIKRIELISPYGGALIDLKVSEEAIPDFTEYAKQLQSIQLSKRSVCDLELLASGAFSPLDRFMNKEDYDRVVDDMRLASGTVFPIPVTLPVDAQLAHLDRDVALRDERNDLLGVMTIEEVYEWDLAEVSKRVFGTVDLRHPLVAEMHGWGKCNLSGQLRLIKMPRHYDFVELRMTPAATRDRLERLGHGNVVAFQTRNPLHRAHEEMTKKAAELVDGVLLLHPVVGMTRSGDVDHYVRVRTYKVLAANHYARSRTLLSLLPLAMRMAGPREALWHALIRRNYGANYMIIGRDHASPGVDSNGKPFYAAYAAQELVEQYSEETGVKVLAFSEYVYLPEEGRYEETSLLSDRVKTATISGTEVRDDYLRNGRALPQWFTRPEVAEILAETYPPRHKQGVCVWFTGLSGAGKSTTAEVLTILLQECGRRVTLLDGDEVRRNLSLGLGFSRKDRDLNIRRIAFVASEIVRHDGAVVCAAVSPYRSTRNDARSMVGNDRFVEVFVDTPLEECEKRDTKGIYAKARRGEIKNLTGIDDPYEPPQHPEIRLTTTDTNAEDNARLILSYLVDHGFVKETQGHPSSSMRFHDDG